MFGGKLVEERIQHEADPEVFFDIAGEGVEAFSCRLEHIFSILFW